MLIQMLSDQELNKLKTKVRNEVQKNFKAFYEMVMRSTTASIFNNIEEVIYKCQVTHAIVNLNFQDFENSMYITDGDIETMLINMEAIIDDPKSINLLQHLWLSYCELEETVIDRTILIESVHEQYADETFKNKYRTE